MCPPHSTCKSLWAMFIGKQSRHETLPKYLNATTSPLIDRQCLLIHADACSLVHELIKLNATFCFDPPLRHTHVWSPSADREFRDIKTAAKTIKSDDSSELDLLTDSLVSHVTFTSLDSILTDHFIDLFAALKNQFWFSLFIFIFLFFSPTEEKHTLSATSSLFLIYF